MHYVIGDRVRTRIDCPPAHEGGYAAPAGTLGFIDHLPAGYSGYGVVLDGDPDRKPVDFASNEIELVTYRPGDKVVCPDRTLRTVDRLADRVGDEPLHLITEDGERLPVAACDRANWADLLNAHRRCTAAGQRVRTDPDPNDPEWRAALDELGRMMDFLQVADSAYRVALAEDAARTAVTAKHPGAVGFGPVGGPGRDEPLGWSYRVRVDGLTRYGVVTYDGDADAYPLFTYRSKAERALMYDRPPALDARRHVLLAAPTARDFRPVTAPGDEQPRAWTYVTGRGIWERFGAVTADRRTIPVLTVDRGSAERWALDETAAPSAAADSSGGATA
ncbi:hypothetical protein H114_32599 [Streptomyces gancidicus BKS 13-15]|uniref:Uncharacterized protein n=1 Tax=Streptomyces gancidicus BKS 13-15 TaxID=1284664 RepID=M3DG76_STREZ|nr:hypothetical protein [Streptomyces gancidicus]EMF20381.1 hypothetical protein H114_32599 [Streptomyces gancidicus BKS 13-15]